jgi:hypothetical protein
VLPQLLSSKISAVVVDNVAFIIAYVGDSGDGLSASNYCYFGWRYCFCSSVVALLLGVDVDVAIRISKETLLIPSYAYTL